MKTHQTVPPLFSSLSTRKRAKWWGSALEGGQENLKTPSKGAGSTTWQTAAKRERIRIWSATFHNRKRPVCGSIRTFPARKIAMSYTQLTQDERYHIQYLSRHCTIAEIAKQLNRHKSTISREIKPLLYVLVCVSTKESFAPQEHLTSFLSLHFFKYFFILTRSNKFIVFNK